MKSCVAGARKVKMTRRACITSARDGKKLNADSLVSVIIIADSPATRMRSYGPCGLLNVKNTKLIDLQIGEIKKKIKNFEIIICTGFESEKINRYVRNKYKSLNIRVVENQGYDNSNSCESLRLCLNNTINKNIVIIDGNLLFSKELLKVQENYKAYTYVQKNNKTLEVGVNVNENENAEYFCFGASKQWCEVIFINDETYVESLRKIVSNPDFKRKFIFEALNVFINNKSTIKILESKTSIQKINNIKVYHTIKDNKK